LQYLDQMTMVVAKHVIAASCSLAHDVA